MIAPAATVGIIVNPLAGTDIRRLSAPAGHTSHAAKVGIVQKIAVAAIEAGARRVLLGDDGAGLARRAAQSIGSAAEVIADIPADAHSRSIVAAQQMWKRDAPWSWPSAATARVATWLSVGRVFH
jgi:predicted polyphosphate/ATP-dependent NAD kinase